MLGGNLWSLLYGDVSVMNGFRTRSDSNWPAQLQRLAEGLNFFIKKQKMLY